MGYSCDCETTWLTTWISTLTKIFPSDECIASFAEQLLLIELNVLNRDNIDYDEQTSYVRESYFQVTPTGGSWQFRNVQVVKNCFNSNFVKHQNIKFELVGDGIPEAKEIWVPPDYDTPRGSPYQVVTYCNVNGSWVRSDGCRNTNGGSNGGAEEYSRKIIRYDTAAYIFQVPIMGTLSYDQCVPGTPNCVRAPQKPTNLNCTRREEFINAGFWPCRFQSETWNVYFRANWSNSHTC